jgi:hypothetical protein
MHRRRYLAGGATPAAQHPLGPFQKRMVVCQRPSIAARAVRATRSAAVV